MLLAVRAGASADPEVAELWQTNLEQRRTVQRHLMDALAAKSPGVAPHAATDVALALLSPETYTHLVRESGWTPERYEAWVLDTVAVAAGAGVTVLLGILPQPLLDLADRAAEFL